MSQYCHNHEKPFSYFQQDKIVKTNRYCILIALQERLDYCSYTDVLVSHELEPGGSYTAEIVVLKYQGREIFSAFIHQHVRLISHQHGLSPLRPHQ